MAIRAASIILGAGIYVRLPGTLHSGSPQTSLLWSVGTNRHSAVFPSDFPSLGWGKRRAEEVSTAITCHLQKRRIHSATAMASASKESAANNPGLTEVIDDATKGYIMQQTMYRIKDPKASLEFYSKVLGMRLLSRFDVPAGRFTLYFMGYEDAESIPTNEMERVKWMFTRRGTVELTHNWGTESDPEFKGYHTGNSDPRGWGHIGITVDDVYKACERFEALGVEFVKKPDQGQMKGIAFIKDPDGYWIEILDTKHMGELVSGEEKALS